MIKSSIFVLACGLFAFILGYVTGPEPQQPATINCKADTVNSFKIKLISLEFNHPTCRRYFT